MTFSWVVRDNKAVTSDWRNGGTRGGERGGVFFLQYFILLNLELLIWQHSQQAVWRPAWKTQEGTQELVLSQYSPPPHSHHSLYENTCSRWTNKHAQSAAAALMSMEWTGEAFQGVVLKVSLLPHAHKPWTWKHHFPPSSHSASILILTPRVTRTPSGCQFSLLPVGGAKWNPAHRCNWCKTVTRYSGNISCCQDNPQQRSVCVRHTHAYFSEEALFIVFQTFCVPQFSKKKTTTTTKKLQNETRFLQGFCVYRCLLQFHQCIRCSELQQTSGFNMAR